MDNLSKNKTLLLLSLLCALLVGYSFFEWSSYKNIPTEKQSLTLAKESVAKASSSFQQFVFDFTNQSTSYTKRVKTEIEKGGNQTSISNLNLKDYQFWGTIIYRNGERWFWDGFVPETYPGDLLSQNESLHVSIDSDNNVTYLYSIIPFFIKQDTSIVRYDVFNRIKISQENILSIGNNLEVNPKDLFTVSDQYPVIFSFGEVNQKDALTSEIISTASTDSLGLIYAVDSSFYQYKQKFLEDVGIWRALFLACFLLLFGFLIVSFSKKMSGWSSLFIQLVAFTSIWLLIKMLYPLLDIQHVNFPLLTNLILVDYIVNSIFSLIVSLLVSSFLIKRKDVERISNAILLSFLVTILFGFLIYKFLLTTTDVITNSSISVMDLELLPSVTTLIFYFCSSISFLSLLIISITICWFILKNSLNTFWLILCALTAGFTSFALLGKLTFAADPSQNWVLVISVLFFFISMVFALFLVKKSHSFLHASKLRLLIFLSYLTVCFVYIAYANGTTERQDKRMLEAAKSYSIDEENEMQTITVNLLKELSQELSNYSINTFNDSFLDQYIQEYIKPEWLRYTISVQVINEDGDRFSDYTTSLSPPQWSTAFRIQELEIPYEDEQIRRENIRPILRSRPINIINSNYSAFIRGWIPIFENPDSDIRTGWILCSVYEELPQLNRPLRTVIFSGDNPTFGETLTSSEYHDGFFIRGSIQGTPLEIPGPLTLSETTLNKVKSDSIVTTSFKYNKEEIKELLVRKGENTIVRIATKKIGLNQHVFSFLRLFFILVILGICIMTMLSGNKNWQIFGYSRRFKDRLIDRFILASIICLLTLVGTSYYVLNAQNSEDVYELLFNKLDNLSSNLESDLANVVTDPAELQRVTSILDVDAAIYKNGLLTNSTTTQIYTQHLLPTSVPWEVFNQIMNNKSIQELSFVELDNQEMVIGYKPWMDENNQVAGIAAIPTFLKAPKFYERLLSTTSLLLAFYTLIFGLLMIGVGFISSQLTSPLESISDALKRISDGDLNVTLPVKSEDEIGTLTKAYNRMAKRLKTVQKELAENEREAAWKEMAQQIAHEIKNPLTPMKLNLQHLERQMDSEEKDMSEIKPKVAKITSSMIEQIDALSKIASDFSKFSKPIEQEFVLLDLNSLIESVAEMYNSDTNFTLVTELIEKPLPIFGAKDELRRVFVNLIKNATEALQENGKIILTTFTDSTYTNAFVTITDNGEGISFEDQEKIFVPNFSTKSSGTGLGLAITKKIIEEHHGEITFISTLGQGTSFTIRIPLSTETAK